MNLNIKSLLEVRGFIKILQLVLAVLVFSTAVNGVYKHEFTRTCTGSGNPFLSAQFGVDVFYPYILTGDKGCVTFNECPVAPPNSPRVDGATTTLKNNSTSESSSNQSEIEAGLESKSNQSKIEAGLESSSNASENEADSVDSLKLQDNSKLLSQVKSNIGQQSSEKCLKFNYKSSSEFFVFIAVICFIYALACILYMVVFELDSGSIDYNKHQTIYYIADIFSSFFFFGMGLISNISFMVVVSGLKSLSSKTYLTNNQFSDYCNDPTVATCTESSSFNHSTLVMSILFSLVHLCVYAASLGMMWRDRVWRSVLPIDNQQAQPVPSSYGAIDQSATGNSYVSGQGIQTKNNAGFLFEHNDPVNLE